MARLDPARKCPIFPTKTNESGQGNATKIGYRTGLRRQGAPISLR